MGKRTGIMLAYPFEEKRLNKWNPPWIVQPKLDGERCRAVVNNGCVTLLSSEENVIVSVPHINAEIAKQFPTGTIELDGELYCHGLPFEEIHSRVSRRVTQHYDAEDIEFHCFDLIEAQNRRLDMSQAERQLMLSRIINNTDHLKLVQFDLANTMRDIEALAESYLQKGYEGFIVRHALAPYVRRRSTNMMKFKPKQHDYYMVVGSIEEISITGQPKGALGALTCDTDGQLFNVGTGFSADQRHELWSIRESLPGRYVKVAYQHLTTGARVPRHPVFCELVELPY